MRVPVYFGGTSLLSCCTGVPRQRGVLGLLALAVLLLHASLPVHSDLSGFVGIAAVVATYLVWKDPTLIMAQGVERFVLVSFVLFILVTVVTTALHPATTSASLRVLLWGLCVFVGYVLSRAWPEHRYSYFAGLTFTLVVTFLLGPIAWEIAGKGHSLWQGDRLKLFAIHPSRLGLYCVAAFFWAVHCLIEAATPRRRLFFGFLGLLLLLMLGLTNTRALFFMVPVGLVFFFFAVSPGMQKKLAVGMLLCFTCVAGVLYLIKDTHSGKRFISVVTNPTKDRTYLSRLPIWEAGWEAFKEAPLLGHGVKSYRKLHAAYLKEHQDDWAIRYPNFERSVKQAHNIVLGRMVETGAVGTVCFLLFFVGSIVCALRGKREDRWISALLVYYLCIGLFDDPLFRVNDSFVMLAAGAAIGMRRPKA